jgi:hypothetical protein
MVGSFRVLSSLSILPSVRKAMLPREILPCSVFVQAEEDPLTASSRYEEHAVHYQTSTVLILSTPCTRGRHDDESVLFPCLDILSR